MPQEVRAARVETAEELTPLPLARSQIAKLCTKGALVTCKLTRYHGDRTIEA